MPIGTYQQQLASYIWMLSLHPPISPTVCGRLSPQISAIPTTIKERKSLTDNDSQNH